MSDRSTSVSEYNTIYHSTFLGASINSFHAQIGWGSSPTTVTVDLAEDDVEDNKKIYVDEYGEYGLHYGRDSFNPPKLGYPVCVNFSSGLFSFNGIVRDWKQNKGNTNTFTVQITDPRTILANTQVILDGYTGPTYNVPNLLNVFGFLENSGIPVTWGGPYWATQPNPKTELLSVLNYFPAWGYGGAKRNDAGIPWWQIKRVVSGLVYDECDDRYGGALRSRDFGVVDTYNDSHKFSIVLSELPDLNDNFRISGTNRDLLSIITEVCDFIGADFYVDMNVEVPAGLPALSDRFLRSGHINKGVIKYITVRISSRQTQPQSAENVDKYRDTAIENRLYYGDINRVVGQTGVLASIRSRGLEMRDDTTNSMVVGDYRQEIWQVAAAGDTTPSTGDAFEHTIWPYWGKDKDGYPILSSGFYDEHTFHLNISGLFYPLEQPEIYWGGYAEDPDTKLPIGIGSPSTLTDFPINVGQLAAALDSVDSWSNYLESWNRNLAIALNIDSIGYHIDNMVGEHEVAQGRLKAEFLKNTSARAMHNSRLAADLSMEYQDILYERIKYYAQQYYGRKFMVNMPFVGAIADPDEPYKTKLSWDIVDAGWTDASSVLDLPNPLSPIGWSTATHKELSYFREDDGRIGCFLRYYHPSGLNITNMNEDDYLLLGSGVDFHQVDGDGNPRNHFNLPTGVLFVKADAEEIVFLSPDTLTYPRAVVSARSPVPSPFIYVSGIPYQISYNAGTLGELTHNIPEAQKVLHLENMMNVAGADTNRWGMLQYTYPTHAAVPLKSNTECYGPWIAATGTNIGVTGSYTSEWWLNYGPAGKTDFQHDTNFSPWNFGSTTIMTTAARALVDSYLMKQQVIEQGSVTIADFPSGTLGDIMAVGGPELTSMTLQLSPGPQTTYNFSTYTPDWGALSKLQIDHLQRIGINQTKARVLYDKAFIGEARKTYNRTSPTNAIFSRSDRFTRSSSQGFFIGEALDGFVPFSGLKMHASGMIARESVTIPELDGSPVTYDAGYIIRSENLVGKVYPSGHYLLLDTITPTYVSDLRKALPQLNVREPSLYQRKAGVENLGLFRPYTTLLPASSHMPSFNHPTGVNAGFGFDGQWGHPSGWKWGGGYVGQPFYGYDFRWNMWMQDSGVWTRATGNYNPELVRNIDWTQKGSGLYDWTTHSGVMPGVNFLVQSGIMQSISDNQYPTGIYEFSMFSTPQVMPPIWGEGNAPITFSSLNPFLGSGTTQYGFRLGDSIGHDIEYIVRDGFAPVNLSVSSPYDNYSTQEWYRSIGLKTPLILAGWGYDIYGKPVPNSMPISGENRSAFFEENWLRKPSKWKVGPLDVRWDERRGVWTAPPSYKLVRAIADEVTETGIYAWIADDDMESSFDAFGNPIPSGRILVSNPGDIAIGSGTSFLASFDPRYENANFSNYKALQAGGGGQIILFKVTDAVPAFSSNPSLPNPFICNAVQAVVENVSCSMAGNVNIGDEVIIWDELGCNFNLPMDLLIGVYGYATRMVTQDLTEEKVYPLEYPCYWVVMRLCCVEEISAWWTI